MGGGALQPVAGLKQQVKRPRGQQLGSTAFQAPTVSCQLFLLEVAVTPSTGDVVVKELSGVSRSGSHSGLQNNVGVDFYDIGWFVNKKVIQLGFEVALKRCSQRSVVPGVS